MICKLISPSNPLTLRHVGVVVVGDGLPDGLVVIELVVHIRVAPLLVGLYGTKLAEDLAMSKENIPYNLYVILVLVYVSFPF